MKTLALAVLLITLSGEFFEARAQQMCGQYGLIAQRLQSVFQERLVGTGIGANGRVAYELWASDQGERTWTLLLISRNMACLRYSGKGWEHIGAS